MKQNKKLTLLAPTIFTLIILLWSSGVKAQVGINQPNPDSSAVLDLKSNNKGVLIPRLTSAQIQSIENPDPSEGLLVYCTDLSIFCYYNGTYWMALPAWGWKLDLGDPSGFGQKISAHILNPDTKVGIGTNTPASKLTVTGNLSIGDTAAAPDSGAYINGKVKIGNPPDPEDTEQLEVDGSINANGKLKENKNDLLPRGAIIMWSGSTAPDGWVLCDGDRYDDSGTKVLSGGLLTPDLSGRFIVAAGTRKPTTLDLDQDTVIEATNSESFNVGPGNEDATDYVKLSTNQMPSHNHAVTATSGNSKTDIWIYGEEGNAQGNRVDLPDPVNGNRSAKQSVYYDPGHNHTITVSNNNKGGNDAHENRPPYYVLAFIIKL